MNRRNFVQSMFGLPLALGAGVAVARAIDVRDFGAVGDSTFNLEKLMRAKKILDEQPLNIGEDGYVFDSRLGVVTVNEWCRAMKDREIIDAMMAS